MKPLICKCAQCRAVRARQRKRSRIQTKQLRAARHKVKVILHKCDYDKIEENLPQVVKVDYYG